MPMTLLTLAATAWIFLCTAVAQSAPPASAPAPSQDSAPVHPAQRSPRHHARVTVDDQVKGLTRNLDLNQDQQEAVKKILERRQQETVHIMRSSTGLDAMDRFRALQAGTVEQIRAVLNDEQCGLDQVHHVLPVETFADTFCEMRVGNTSHTPYLFK